MKKKIFALCLVLALAATAIIGGTLAYFTDTTEEVKNTFTMGNVNITLDEQDVKNPNGDRVTANDYTDAMVPGKVFTKDPTIHVAENSQDSYVFLEMTFNKYNSLFWVMAADASADKEINFSIFTDETCTAVKPEFQNDKGQFSTTKFLAYFADGANKAVFQQIVNKWFHGIEHTNWQVMLSDMGNVNKSCFTIRLAYIGGEKNGVVSANDVIKFMDSFGMPASVTQEMIDAGVTVGKQANTFNTDKASFKMNFTAYAIQAAEINGIDAAYAALFN